MSITPLSDVSISKLSFSEVNEKTLPNGTKIKSVNISYGGDKLQLETPSLRVPYGVNVNDNNDGSPKKYSLSLSFDNANDNSKKLQTFLEEFDSFILDTAMKNSVKWLKNPKPTLDGIKAVYYPTVKVSLDKDGNPKPYPPTLKLALRKRQTGNFETEFYDGTKMPLVTFPADMPIEEIIPKRTSCTVIMECTGVWFAGGKFGTTWKANQLRVDSQPEQLRGPAFSSPSPYSAPSSYSEAAGGSFAAEEEELMAAVMPAAVAAPTFTEEENDAEEEDAPPPPKAAPKVVKKVVKKASS